MLSKYDCFQFYHSEPDYCWQEMMIAIMSLNSGSAVLWTRRYLRALRRRGYQL